MIICIITARGGSKGIPGKNIKVLGDKPLIAYSIIVAHKSRLITHSIVSSDDEEIIKISKKYGASVPFIRPAELAKDNTPHLPVVQHAVSFMEEKLSLIFDYVVIFQPTSPFRTVDDVDRTIKKLIDSGADTAWSMCKIESTYHPVKIKKMDGDKVFPYYVAEPENSRRQELPLAYRRSSAVYVSRRDLIMKNNRLFGDNIVGHIVPADQFIDIDTSLDWLKAEYMLKSLKQKGLSW